jgi:drug/metabolite transporter (DMT)-like permease
MVEERRGIARFIARFKVSPLAGLLLLCFLWSVASLRSDLFPGLTPDSLPPIERQALSFALLAVAAALFSLLRKAQWPDRRRFLAAVLVGLGLFIAPAVSFCFAKEWVGNLTQVALFSITPVFAVVFEPYIGNRDSASQSRGGLLAALAAVVGTLCVIPAGAPNSIVVAGAFCVVILAAACVAAANCLAVNTAAQLSQKAQLAQQSIAPMAAIAALSAVGGLVLLSALFERPVWRLNALGPELAWSAVAELPELLLLFWLMRRMSAVRMTTRFVATPLMASLIGLVLLRPAVGLRAGAGLILMAVGAGWLLFAPEASGPDTSPLNLD